MPTIPVDYEGLKALLDAARRNGRVDQWCELALDWAKQASQYIEAYEITADRLQEAQEYCNHYRPVGSLGRNVWHVILDDALKLRQRLEMFETREVD